jgi:hypothetical protein
MSMKFSNDNIKPTASGLVAQCLKQLHHRVW